MIYECQKGHEKILNISMAWEYNQMYPQPLVLIRMITTDKNNKISRENKGWWLRRELKYFCNVGGKM